MSEERVLSLIASVGERLYVAEGGAWTADLDKARRFHARGSALGYSAAWLAARGRHVLIIDPTLIKKEPRP